MGLEPGNDLRRNAQPSQLDQRARHQRGRALFVAARRLGLAQAHRDLLQRARRQAQALEQALEREIGVFPVQQIAQVHPGLQVDDFA
ncbi:hypothetical protein D3C81_1701710 [compost metagenome]